MYDTKENAFQAAFLEELEEMSDSSDMPFQELTQVEIGILTNKILCLPQQLRTIICFYYAYEHSIAEITQLLEIDLVQKKLQYTKDLLVAGMGLKNMQISEQSLKSACKRAVTEEVNRLYTQK